VAAGARIEFDVCFSVHRKVGIHLS
jgi:hypothetical protein